MSLAFKLSPTNILPNLEAHSKKLVLKAMALVAAGCSGLPEKEIFSGLMERELHGCSGLGGGVCIPHARIEGIHEASAVFARLDHPVEFGAADQHPVDLIFLLVTPAGNDKAHVNAIASASRLLRDKALCDRLRQAHTAEKLYQLLSGIQGSDSPP